MKTFCALISLFATAICLFSCSKKVTGPLYFTHSDVQALRVGNWWQYELSDSIIHTLDTPTLSIVAVYHAGGTDSAIGLISHHGSVIDTAFITERDSSMVFRSRYLGSYTMQLPCKAGDTWTGSSLPGDTVTVLSMTATSDGTVCQMHEWIDISDAYVNADMTVTSYSGLTKSHVYVSTFGGVSRWFGLRLLDHHLN